MTEVLTLYILIYLQNQHVPIEPARFKKKVRYKLARQRFDVNVFYSEIWLVIVITELKSFILNNMQKQ